MRRKIWILLFPIFLVLILPNENFPIFYDFLIILILGSVVFFSNSLSIIWIFTIFSCGIILTNSESYECLDFYINRFEYIYEKVFGNYFYAYSNSDSIKNYFKINDILSYCFFLLYFLAIIFFYWKRLREK